jgi:NADH dehydrogenase
VAARRPGDVRIATQSANAPKIIQADLLHEVSVGSAVAGADAVLNLVGILTETGPQTYRAIHVEGAGRVALAAQRHGVIRLIHISALGASPTSPAISDQTKAEGEQAVRALFPQATVVRPSLTFGKGDHFFSRFAAIVKNSPILPLIGGGTTKFQPVFVGDMTLDCSNFSIAPNRLAKPTNFGDHGFTTSKRFWSS